MWQKDKNQPGHTTIDMKTNTNKTKLENEQFCWGVICKIRNSTTCSVCIYNIHTQSMPWKAKLHSGQLYTKHTTPKACDIWCTGHLKNVTYFLNECISQNVHLLLCYIALKAKCYLKILDHVWLEWARVSS